MRRSLLVSIYFNIYTFFCLFFISSCKLNFISIYFRVFYLYTFLRRSFPPPPPVRQSPSLILSLYLSCLCVFILSSFLLLLHPRVSLPWSRVFSKVIWLVLPLFYLFFLSLFLSPFLLLRHLRVSLSRSRVFIEVIWLVSSLFTCFAHICCSFYFSFSPLLFFTVHFSTFFRPRVALSSLWVLFTMLFCFLLIYFLLICWFFSIFYSRTVCFLQQCNILLPILFYHQFIISFFTLCYFFHSYVLLSSTISSPTHYPPIFPFLSFIR